MEETLSSVIMENGHKFVSGEHAGVGKRSTLSARQLCLYCGTIRLANKKNKPCLGRAPGGAK